MLDYNVPRGNLNRGLSFIQSYKMLIEGNELIEDEIFRANTLGWCIEWADFLVHDDIMDNSHTRRGQPCWFKVPKVGMIVVNDGVLLRNHIRRILRKHFRDKPYYLHLLDLFDEVEFHIASSQMIDLITTLEGEKDLYYHIVQYKTTYYSFYLLNLDNHIDVKNILVEMRGLLSSTGKDDYLDCFGDPETTSKIRTDIEDFKCSWLLVKALELSNEAQKKDNYEKPDPANVANVKSLYRELDLHGVFVEYESETYNKLTTIVEVHLSKAVQAVWKAILGRIHKRKK
ncbi:hypothetical protein I3842_Q085200 [Carya illinoinensis]|uniref:Uncharacterized protein n=1 Tax=Carya illinoinensis TaxID=32201 RepID=A0A922A2J8_CARIL|nr:hypothetical protein I3842_Q085200 [Carya illinoinensis]